MAEKSLVNINFWLFITMITLLTYQNLSVNDFSKITTVYESSQDNFPNPERGFFTTSNPIDNGQNQPLQLSEIKKVRNRKMTLVRRYYLISEFKEQPISHFFLKMILKDCEVARQAGVKLIIRFAYNWIGGGSDVSKVRIFSHLEQLKPILSANYDVIAYMEAGFIGYWGEWHTSSNGLDINPQARKEILFKILSVLPTERMVAIRYSHYKRDAFQNDKPLTSQEAFNTTYRARTGNHNDCFLASIDDGGSYLHTDPKIVNDQKAFLNLDNRYVVQGGEVCRASQYDNCPNALKELERMHWSVLNAEVVDGKEVLEKWKANGCLEEIKRRLGYRFRLLKSAIPQRVHAGDALSMKFSIINDGWASPYNPRKLEVILRNTQNKIEYYFPVNEDPRRWMPNTTKVVDIVGGVPKNIPAGKYQIFLNLPDPTPSLYHRPEYSIRLANQGVWEKSTGYNSLLQTLIVETYSSSHNYSGNHFFKHKN